jgi:AsmA protein
MRTVKILAGLVGGILVLCVAGLLAVRLLVNPNDYKAKIVTLVKESTGRDLVLKGDIELSVFPWVALQLGPASLGNPPGFGAEPFLTLDHAAVRVKLLPILAKHLVIDRVELGGLDVRLRRNDQGQGNWENVGAAPPPEANAGVGDGTAATQLLASLAGIRISNGRVSYPGIVIEKFNLETGAFAFGEQGVTPVSITLDAHREAPQRDSAQAGAAQRGAVHENLTLNARFDLSADPHSRRWRFDAVNCNGLFGGPGDDRPAHWEMSAPQIEVDLPAQTLAVPEFALSYSNARLTGKLQATNIFDDVGVTGTVALAPLVLHEFAPRLGMVLPRTRDPKAFALFSAGSEFSYGADGLRLEQLQAQLDDSHLRGTVAFSGGEPRALKFDLTVDQIQVDRYLSTDTGPAPPPASSAPAGAADASPPARDTTAKTPDIDMDGTLSVGSLQLSPLQFTNVRLTLASKDGVLHLFPSLAQIDGGSYSGNITLDRRGAMPVLTLDEHLNGVDMSRLLAGTPYGKHMSGRGTVNVKATARGAELDGLMQSLNGHVDAKVANGAIEGIDLGYELGRARALIKHEAEPAGSKPPRTRFDAFEMSAAITNGVAKTSDLTISSAALRVTGQGSANLVNKAIDFQMLASILKSPGASMADIPLKITGTYVNPTVKPDVEALAKGQLKQKIEDVLKKNGLGGLFVK